MHFNNRHHLLSNELKSVTIRQRKYVPDLASYGLLCELNYARLLKLLPQCQPAGRSYDYAIESNVSYRLTVLECHKYTTVISLCELSPQYHSTRLPTMEVRLYHDANMAEVTACQNFGKIEGYYQYPNQKMMQKDEKFQLNQLLQTWLKICHDQGQVIIDLSLFK